MYGIQCIITICLCLITTAENLHSFVFNISEVEYLFQCGRRFCYGFHNYCYYRDEDIQEGICRPCTEDMCRYKLKVPKQCQLMCKAFGQITDSDKISLCTDQSTHRTQSLRITQSMKELETKLLFWRTLCMISMALFIVLLLILYKSCCYKRTKDALKQCMERHWERAHQSIITSPSDCNGETEQLQDNSTQNNVV